MKSFSTLLCLLLPLLLGCTSSSPNKIFRDEIIDPIPASVTILEGEDTGGLSVNLYLHFRIHRPDVDAIIATQSYIKDDAALPASMFQNEARKPTWWIPESLGNDRIQYVKEIIPAGGAESLGRRYLIASKSHEEVFFLSFYYY